MSALRVVIEPAPPDAAAGAYARVRAFDESGDMLQAPFDFAFSVAPEDTALLRWAAVEYAAWPFGGYAERARLAAARAVAVGSALYRTALAPVASVLPSSVVIETTLAQALRLPWELLHDGERFIALADPPCAIVRAAGNGASEVRTPGAVPAVATPLRIVLVTARPTDAVSVDLRLVAQRLYRRLDARIRAGAVAVEYLRPPTFDALVARLSAEPPVDVVHFDGHGTAGNAGPGGGPALVFEDARYRSELIPAERYARALAGAGVATSILTACETATVTDGKIESAAAAIVDAGIGAVVAMGDEILVDSAADYADAFYAALSGGSGVAAAHSGARVALARRATLSADWWTPQLYASGNVATSPDAAPAAEGALETASAEPAGFVGRARELLSIDRAFAAGSHVVVRGFAGAGKTALAREAARWLALTGAFESVRTIDCAEGAPAALAALGTCSATDVAVAPVARRALVIVDGLDLLDGAVDAATLASALVALARTSALLVTTRDMRESPPAFAPAVAWKFVNVGALATSEALDFARRCSSAGGTAPGTLDRSAIEATIARSGGLPFGIASEATADAPLDDAAFAAWAPLIGSSLARLGEDDRAIVAELREFVRGANFFTARTLCNLERDRFASFVEELRRVGLGDAVPLTNLPEGKMLCLKLHPALAPLERARSGPDRDLALRFARAYDDMSASLAVGSAADPYVPANLYAFERPNLERAAATYETLGMLAEAAALRTSLDALAGQFGGHLDDFGIGPKTFDDSAATLAAARETLAAAQAQPSPDPLAVANARVIVGIALDRAGDTPGAVEETRQACTALAALTLQQAQAPAQTQPGDMPSRVAAGYLMALVNLGGLQRKLGHTEDARAAFQLAAPLADASDRPASITVHTMLGGVTTDAQEANVQYGLALKYARLISARGEEAAALFGLADVARRTGNSDEAERKTREAVSVCAAIGDVRRVASGYFTLGSLAAGRGVPEEAERWFATLRGSAGYAACDGRTRAFFDASIAAELANVVLNWLGTDATVKTATTVLAWQAAVRPLLASDAEMQRRLASAKDLAENVVAQYGNDPGCVAVGIARGELERIARMEGTTQAT